VLVNGLYDRQFYNGEIYTEPMIVDRNSILAGGARLRQVRVKSGNMFIYIYDFLFPIYF